MNRTTSAVGGAVFSAPKVEKGDATTRAARAIIDKEIADRDAKTARLRALRLAKEAEEAAVEAAKPAPTKTSGAKTSAAKKAAAKPRKRAVEPA